MEKAFLIRFNFIYKKGKAMDKILLVYAIDYKGACKRIKENLNNDSVECRDFTNLTLI